MSRKLAVLGVALLAACGGVASAQQAEHAVFTREARLSIGADGKITTLTFDDWKAKNDLIAQRLEPLIRSWTFEPGTVDGQPMPTETTLHVQLEMLKTADDRYPIKLLDAFTGPAVLKLFPPDYPRHALRDGAEANVTVILAVDASGVPASIGAPDVITNGSNQSKTEFADAVISSAKNWRFQPETVGGHPVASHVRMPVSFCLDKANHCPSIAKEVAAQRDATPANTPIALDSKVKLLTRIAGTML